MHYSDIINQHMARAKIKLITRFNSYIRKTSNDQHWIIDLPDVDFRPRTLLLIELQDYITHSASGVYELEIIEQKYKHHADRVIVMHWTRDLALHYSGPLHLLEFSSHNWRECQRLIDCRSQWLDLVSRPKTHDWQCLNGRITPHRQRVCNNLVSLSNGVMSLGDRRPLKDWPYSTYQGTENIDNFLRLQQVYGSCAVNLVTETQYDRPPGIITEKTFYAMAAGQIPILIGHAGIVQDLENLGFDTFRDLVDTAYDCMPNGVRAEMAISLNLPLITGKIDLAPYRDRLIRQQHRVLAYADVMLKKLDKDVISLIDVVL